MHNKHTEFGEKQEKKVSLSHSKLNLCFVLNFLSMVCQLIFMKLWSKSPREEGCILTRNFRGFNLWGLGQSIMLADAYSRGWSTHNGQRVRKGARITLKDTPCLPSPPCDLLLPTRPYHLKFPESLKYCHHLGTKHLAHEPVRGNFMFKS